MKTYEEYEQMGVFDDDQLIQIRKGLLLDLDVSEITSLDSKGRPLYDHNQMQDMLWSLETRDSSVYEWDGKSKIPGDVSYVRIQDGVTSIPAYAFANHSDLKDVYISDSVTTIGPCCFKGCSSLQSVILHDNVVNLFSGVFSKCSDLKMVVIPDSVSGVLSSGMFFKCDSLSYVKLSDNIDTICSDAFVECSSLESVDLPLNLMCIKDFAFRKCDSLDCISLPDGVGSVAAKSFENFKDLKVLYRNHDIYEFLDYDAYGVDNFTIIKYLSDNNLNINGILFAKAVEAEHADRLREFVADYPLYGDMSVSSSMRVISDERKSVLKNLFSKNTKTGCRIPKKLNELAIMSQSLNIPENVIVDTFDFRYTKNVVDESKPFIPSMACRCYFSKNVCDALDERGLSSLVAESIGRYNVSNNECHKNAFNFIVDHMNANSRLLSDVSRNAKDFTIDETTTISDIKKQIRRRESMGEVYKINKEYEEYGVDIMKCTCSIPVLQTVYDDRVSRILDFNDAADIAEGASLGYATNCCQHLGSAGETAMMHGFLNPDAGFFVIEDKNGKIKAQAEIWLDGDTLVFDNIEFANTSGEDYDRRVKQLRNDLAYFVENCDYPNIVMGCGYNEFNHKKMEKSPVPMLTMSAFEVYALQADNDASVSFDTVEDAEKYMQSKKYDPDDFVYSDANDKCVYLKHDGVVSEYLLKGFDKDKCGEVTLMGSESELQALCNDMHKDDSLDRNFVSDTLSPDDELVLAVC